MPYGKCMHPRKCVCIVFHQDEVVSASSGHLDRMNPKTPEEFEEFRQALTKKITEFEVRSHFVVDRRGRSLVLSPPSFPMLPPSPSHSSLPPLSPSSPSLPPLSLSLLLRLVHTTPHFLRGYFDQSVHHVSVCVCVCVCMCVCQV